MSEPRCYLDEDGEHFHFVHACRDVAKQLADAGHPLKADVAARWQQGSNDRLLPISDNMLPNSWDGWTITSREPLTISPSILCGQCGVHGFWRNDAWVPA